MRSKTALAEAAAAARLADERARFGVREASLAVRSIVAEGCCWPRRFLAPPGFELISVVEQQASVSRARSTLLAAVCCAI